MKAKRSVFLTATIVAIGVCILAGGSWAQDVCFLMASSYPVGSIPQSVAAADFDGDGYPDLAVANNGSNNVSVLHNSGDGSFAAPVNYPAGTSPTCVRSGDLDGDGHPDLVVVNYGGGDISVLKNNGDGTFALAVNYAVGSSPRSVFAADFDADGDLDLAVANSGSGSGSVSVLVNNGDGTFASAVNYPLQGGAMQPVSVTATDLDGDGDIDLATANSNYSNVSVLKNNGNGTFSAAVSYPLGGYAFPVGLVAADLDGDGDQDLAVADSYNGRVAILKNDGSGAFAATGYYPTGANPRSIDAADLDGGGVIDLITANMDGRNVSILINNGGGTFAPAMNYPAGAAPPSGNVPLAVIADDLDGDGHMDLAVASGVPLSGYVGDVTVMKNRGNGTMAVASRYGISAWYGSNPQSVVAADLNGDGYRDLAVAVKGSSKICVVKNNGNGTFADPPSSAFYLSGNNPFALVAADLDGDGDRDLAVANYDKYGDGNVSILRNNGDATFAAPETYDAGINPCWIAASDLDGDGDIDLSVANNSSSNVSILKNNGDGTFASAVNYPVGSSPSGICAADLDGDGDADLATADYGSNQVSVLKNNGDGTFAAAVTYATDTGPNSVVAADLDDDGDRDLAVANWDGSTVSVLTNNGDGTFAFKVNYFAGGKPVTVFAADLNGDGHCDLEVSAGLNVGILKNNGGGILAPVVNYPTGGSDAACVFAADLDGDGKTDLAVANYGSSDMTVLLNCPATPTTCWTLTPPNLDFGSIQGGQSADLSFTFHNCGTAVLSGTVDEPCPEYSIVSGGGSYTLSSGQSRVVTVRFTAPLPGTHACAIGMSDILGANVPCTGVSLCACPHQGDLAENGFVDVSDVLKVIGIAFVNGADTQDPGCPKTRGDVNNDGVVDVNDVLYIIRTAFLNGPNPVDPCGP